MQKKYVKLILFGVFILGSLRGAADDQYQQQQQPAIQENQPDLEQQVEIPPESEILVRYGESQAAELSAEKSVKVLIWNVRKFDRPATYRHVQRLARIADFKLIQESIMNSTAADFFNEKTIGFETNGAISFLDEKKTGTGVSTSHRVLAKSITPIRSREVEPVIKTPKMILLTEHSVQGREESLLVANIHGLNFVPNEKFAVQLAQLEAALSQHQGHIILGGDFNTHNVDKAVMVGEMARRIGLTYVQMEGANGIGLRLDHLFVRGFDVVKAQLLKDVKSSDHLPLWAELKFKSDEKN